MRGLYLREGAVTVRSDLPPPLQRDDEVRVRVLCAGVCATDLALARGYMDFEGVPGHEFVGEALDGPLRGRRVVGEINAGCGHCADCAAGDSRHCRERTVLGILGRSGAFAEELALPAANLHAVPDALPNDHAVFAEPLAAAFEIAEQVELSAGDRALVAGDGRLGLLCAQVLALRGLEVTLLGRHPERAAWFPGIRHETAPLSGPPGAPDPAGARDFDLAVEATGDPEALSAILQRVRPRGTVVLKTTTERPATLDFARVVVDELTLVGSRCGPFEPALASLAAGDVRVEPMISARFPLSEGPAAFEHASRPGILKVLMDMEQA